MEAKSEDVLGKKWDHCLADTFIKMGAGVLTGAALSFVLFKRRKWPIIFGLGTGLGMGMSNCQHSLNAPLCAKLKEMKQKRLEAKKSESKEENVPSEK